MQVGDLVRIRPRGVSQFRVLEIDGTDARIMATQEAPGAYPFSMPITDLILWTE